MVDPTEFFKRDSTRVATSRPIAFRPRSHSQSQPEHVVPSTSQPSATSQSHVSATEPRRRSERGSSQLFPPSSSSSLPHAEQTEVIDNIPETQLADDASNALPSKPKRSSRRSVASSSQPAAVVEKEVTKPKSRKLAANVVNKALKRQSTASKATAGTSRGQKRSRRQEKSPGNESSEGEAYHPEDEIVEEAPKQAKRRRNAKASGDKFADRSFEHQGPTFRATISAIGDGLSQAVDNAKTAFRDDETALDDFYERTMRAIEVQMMKQHERILLQQSAQRIHRQVEMTRLELLRTTQKRDELDRRLQELVKLQKERAERERVRARVDEFFSRWGALTAVAQQSSSSQTTYHGEVANANNLEAVLLEIETVANLARNVLPAVADTFTSVLERASS